MGLTRIKSLDELEARLDALTETIADLRIELQLQIDALQESVFADVILLEPDTDWDVVRSKRNLLLKKTDWTMISGVTVDQRVWSIYRQILRDIPQTFAQVGPDKVVWPNLPSTSGPNTPVEIE